MTTCADCLVWSIPSPETKRTAFPAVPRQSLAGLGDADRAGIFFFRRIRNPCSRRTGVELDDPPISALPDKDRKTPPPTLERAHLRKGSESVRCLAAMIRRESLFVKGKRGKEAGGNRCQPGLIPWPRPADQAWFRFPLRRPFQRRPHQLFPTASRQGKGGDRATGGEPLNRTVWRGYGIAFRRLPFFY